MRPPQVHCAPPLIISEGDAASGSGLVGWCLNTLNIIDPILNQEFNEHVVFFCQREICYTLKPRNERNGWGYGKQEIDGEQPTAAGELSQTQTLHDWRASPIAKEGEVICRFAVLNHCC